jgi:hypothetical protein
MAIGAGEDVGYDRILHFPAAVFKALDDEGGERFDRDHPQLHRLGAAPERLVGVVEDALHDVVLAAEVHVGDLRLALENRAQELGQGGIDIDDLLELVDDEGDTAAPGAAELGGKLQQPFQGGIDLGGPLGDAEAEGEAAIVGIDVDRRLNLQATKRRKRLLSNPLQRRGDLLVDRPRQGRGEALLGRGGHQVDLGDQHPLPRQGIGGAPDQGGLAAAARGEDDDVLAVADVTGQLGKLAFSIGEGIVEG